MGSIRVKSVDTPPEAFLKMGAGLQKAICLRAEVEVGAVVVFHEVKNGKRTGSYLRAEVTHVFTPRALASSGIQRWIASFEITHFLFEDGPEFPPFYDQQVLA